MNAPLDFHLIDMLRKYMTSILDILSSFNIPYISTLREYLLLPDAPYIVAGVAFGYIIICAIVGRVSENKAFFFNYLDVFITFMVVILPFATYLLYENKYISDAVRIWVNISILPIFFVLIWIISYRSNFGKLLPALFMFLGKVIFLFCLGIILVVTLFFSVLALMFAMATKRKKYQRRKTHQKQQGRMAVAPIGLGAGIALGLIAFCCKYSGFSMPDKVVKNFEQDHIEENSEA